MTAVELINKLDNYVSYLQGPILADFSKVALDLTANVADRIQEEGKSAKGSALKAYTKKYLDFKQNPKKYKRGRDMGLASSIYTGKTDYALKGEFWLDMGIITESINEEIKVSIGPSKEVNIAKYKSLTKRDGQEPLEPSEEEIQRAAENLEARILQQL